MIQFFALILNKTLIRRPHKRLIANSDSWLKIGGLSMKSAVQIPIYVILVATLGAAALTYFATTSTSGWTTGTIQIWLVLGVITVVGFMLGILKVAGIKI